MTINAITIKLFGNKNTVFRVLNATGEVVQVLATKEEAEAWIKSN